MPRPRDAALLRQMGTGNNVPGNVFTIDGRKPHLPSASDHFPNTQTNVVPIYLSMGAYNALQQSDAHAYWEFKYQGTNWVHPLYELPFTGGFPDKFGAAPDAFGDGEIGKLQSIVPGSGPSGVKNDPRAVAREINDGLLAPRFSPSQRAWVLTGTRVAVSPAVPASAGRDADDR